MNFLRNNIGWFVLIAVFLAFTPLVFYLADLERGFDATGGEIFFPLIPFVIWGIARTVKETTQEIRKDVEND